MLDVLPKGVNYRGVDLGKGLIEKARTRGDFFTLADVCKPLELGLFSHVTAILCLQNMEKPAAAIQNASDNIKRGGTFVIVLNHPAFRIPRQTHWEIDEKQKLQYRRVNRYLSPLKIPIQMQPSKGQSSKTTWSFHHPISDYSKWLYESKFVIELIEEWVSTKQSTGRAAKMENLARKEFPLFLAIKASKI